MFTVRASHGRALHSPLLLKNRPSLFPTAYRRAAGTSTASRYLDSTLLGAEGPVAEQLAATGIWRSHGDKTRRRKKPPGDKARVNIVGDQLCDDILSYIGSSLERHRGCDILDIYPGAGLWSSKLHQFLRPRSHVLLEPDAQLYGPFLGPLLDKPGTSLVPKSGIIWRELNSVLTPEFLPHQTQPEDLGTRNDTLLVIANLAFHPKKRFLSFDSITSLLLHQFVSAIGTASLFQRYGLVRMLVWVRADDTLNFLPRYIQRRKRQAIQNDLFCDWIHEVCGDETASSGWYAREDAIDRASLVATIKRMKKAGRKLPAGRESEDFLKALAGLKRKDPMQLPGDVVPTFQRRFIGALADLKATELDHDGDGDDSADSEAINRYEARARADSKKNERILATSQHLDELLALLKSGRSSRKTIEASELEWDTEIRELSKIFLSEFVTYRHNLEAFRRTPPLLQWDRRDYEPMTVRAEEFFPNIQCSLLDIQPKAPHALFRQTGPGSNRAADICDIVLGSLMDRCTKPVVPDLDAVWPGASDYILPRWTSTQDLSRGGFRQNIRYAEPVLRLLDSGQLEELFELWMEWPFRPEFHELVGRMQDDVADEDLPPHE